MKMPGYFHNAHLAFQAHAALIKPMRSHTCVSVLQRQAPQLLDNSGITYRLSLHTTTGEKAFHLSVDEHETMG